MQKAEIEAQAKAILKEHPDWGRKTIAQKLGVPENGSLRRILEKLKAGLPVQRKVEQTQAEPSESREFSGNTAVLSTLKYGIRTLDQLLDYMEVDRSVWRVKRWVANKWEVASAKPHLTANSESGFAKEPLFQVKAWLERNPIEEKASSLFTELLAQFRKAAPKQRKAFTPAKSQLLFEVDIFDPHFGKLCWHRETGKDYDINIAEKEYGAALEGLIHRIGGQKVDRILYPIGNDFFHVDNARNETEAGTAQDCDGRWQKSFIQGRKAVKDSIDRLREIAPVDVVMVAGNHDPERVFYLGEVLAGWYHRTDGVTVNNDPTQRKYYRYGANLIGFTHGKFEKLADLPLIMATEAPEHWAQTKFREVHTGHLHHLKTMMFLPSQEFNTIRVRVLSSLTPPDAWHKRMGYEGLRSANGFLWDKADGCVAALSFNSTS